MRKEDKTSWTKTVQICRSQLVYTWTCVLHINGTMTCGALSLVLIKDAMRDYQRMAPSKLSDEVLESIL